VPYRITDETVEMLGSYVELGKRSIGLVAHVESIYEVTLELADAVYKLKSREYTFTTDKFSRSRTVDVLRLVL